MTWAFPAPTGPVLGSKSPPGCDGRAPTQPCSSPGRWRLREAHVGGEAHAENEARRSCVSLALVPEGLTPPPPGPGLSPPLPWEGAPGSLPGTLPLKWHCTGWEQGWEWREKRLPFLGGARTPQSWAFREENPGPPPSAPDAPGHEDDPAPQSSPVTPAVGPQIGDARVSRIVSAAGGGGTDSGGAARGAAPGPSHGQPPRERRGTREVLCGRQPSQPQPC